jgi:galactokinase
MGASDLTPEDTMAIGKLIAAAREHRILITGGKVRRTSSRFCLGVEHGDYNGTELFGVATDRFIWLGYRPNNTDTVRIYSTNFPQDGVIVFRLGTVPEPLSPSIADTWARFPYGVDHILRQNGIALKHGFDAVIHGNIPGGGMSRSASLAVNLVLTCLEVNHVELTDRFAIVDLAQAVENEYIGSPCGKLDQIMILFGQEGMGTHYNPTAKTVDHVPLGAGAIDFRLVSLDTGTVRPGLEKSTYRIRRKECEEMVLLAQKAGFKIARLADIKEIGLFKRIHARFHESHADLCARMMYIFEAQRRFHDMLAAWKQGHIETVGRIFRQDGLGLRDEYRISGPELETMCDIARTVPGVLGERMLGGGDKGAAGAIVKAESVDALKQAIDTAYPRSHPPYATKYSVHVCKAVDGVRVFEGALG